MPVRQKRKLRHLLLEYTSVLRVSEVYMLEFKFKYLYHTLYTCFLPHQVIYTWIPDVLIGQPQSTWLSINKAAHANRDRLYNYLLEKSPVISQNGSLS